MVMQHFFLAISYYIHMKLSLYLYIKMCKKNNLFDSDFATIQVPIY